LTLHDDSRVDVAAVPASERLPGPVITVANRPYWEAAQRGEFRLPRCTNCRGWVYPFAPVCPECGEIGLFEWVEPSGRATLNSWVIYHRPFGPFTVDDVPYAVVEVELEEGPRMISSVVAATEPLSVGMRLRVAFRSVTDELTLVVFEPDRSATA
jgi:uncharacterized OB-fold protein